jgi:hydrogenase-4 component B
VPSHVWMPRGYRAAPGPLRAVMAGVAVNVGFYGMWRTLDLLQGPPGWLAVAVLLLGGCTALLGIAHATVGTDLATVVAYSSVENGGLICVGYGVALVGAAIGQPPLTAVGLLAATLQMVAHALGKSLLFCATSGIEDATGTTRLDDLRGVGHRLPVSGTGLAVGALTLAGLPLTVGFVSEWFLLESLMQQFRVGRLDYALPLAAAGALVALTVGFAAVAFVRLVGLVVLGPPRVGPSAEPPARGRDVGALGASGLAVLAAGCVAIAAVAPLWIRVLAAGLDAVVPQGVSGGALQGPWVVQPVYPEFSALSPSWLAVAMPALLLAVVALGAALSRNRMFAVRRVPVWRSATGGVDGESQYTPFGFANPTRKVLANVLLTRSELRTVEQATGGRADDPQRTAAGAHLGYTTDVVEIVEQFLLRPLGRALLAAVRTAKRLQSGRLDAYLGYMLVAVIAVLAIVVGIR